MSNGMMKAVVTTGNGGYDRLVYRDVPIPSPGRDEVLVRVLAAGINNTEINTRLGWYASSVDDATNALAGREADAAESAVDGGWNGATPFPLIQGTDCCGRVVACGDDAGEALIGERVLVRPCMRNQGFDAWSHRWMASDFDGAFAEYVKVPAGEAFPVTCDWSDQELATIPCAYGTAENMLHRAGVARGDRVLITGASGGVGSAALQLARRRGARVVAVASREKHPVLQELGAEHLLGREEHLLAVLGESSLDVVVDNVAGSHFGERLKLLRPGGCLVTSGAIAGPRVELDLRDLYLKDIRLLGTTAWDEPIFPNLVRYIEQGEIRPLLAGSYPLQDIVQAQQVFLEKRHVGKLVLVPPAESTED